MTDVFRSRRPDPNVPPLPPHVTMKNVRNYLSALWHRDTDSVAMMKGTMKEMWATQFPDSNE